MAGKLVHFEIKASDADRAVGFWSGVFGWTFGDSGMPGIDYRMTQTSDDQGGAIYPSEERDGCIVIYFDTDDIEASIAKVRELGGETGDKEPIPGVGWFSHGKDPDGNAFGLFQADDSVAPPE